MKKEDIEFHERILRGLKGILKAYEGWIDAKRTTAAQ